MSIGAFMKFQSMQYFRPIRDVKRQKQEQVGGPSVSPSLHFSLGSLFLHNRPIMYSSPSLQPSTPSSTYPTQHPLQNIRLKHTLSARPNPHTLYPTLLQLCNINVHRTFPQVHHMGHKLTPCRGLRGL